MNAWFFTAFKDNGENDFRASFTVGKIPSTVSKRLHMDSLSRTLDCVSMERMTVRWVTWETQASGLKRSLGTIRILVKSPLIGDTPYILQYNRTHILELF